MKEIEKKERKRLMTRLWYSKNRDRERARARKWHHENRDKSNATSRRYYLGHKKELILHRSIYARNNSMSINGKVQTVRKRQFYDICEICKSTISGKHKLNWHHWNDEYPEIGLWLCHICHKKAEVLEHFVEMPDSFKELYTKLKIIVETG